MSADKTAVANTSLTQSQSGMVLDIRAEADDFFDDSSKSVDALPVLKLIVCSVCTGKTTYRHTKFAQGYVAIDAAEIFLKLSRRPPFEPPEGLPRETTQPHEKTFLLRKNFIVGVKLSCVMTLLK